MGQYRVEVVAVGGHGCQREVKDGGTVTGCGGSYCPDCAAREFVDGLKRRGHIERATLTHWPGTKEEVIDDLLTGKRKGSFG